MGSKWQITTLGNVCSKIGSGATPRGGIKVYQNEGEISLIRSQNVYNTGFVREGLPYISLKHAEQLSNVEVMSNDVLLNITGDSVARCCQVVDDVLPARVNQHVAIIRPDSETLDPRFLRYYLVSPGMQSQMLSWAGSGGTRNALTKGMIESFKISVPEDIKEQHAIAHILGSLDDKIELNRKMNETLEAMARAVFKSWFVDFDPVRAKAEGRDTGLPKEIADLFPDSFQDSELGEIPKGWEIKSLDRIADYLNGLACQKYPPEEGKESLPVIKIRELRQGITANTDRATTAIPGNYIVEDGDVLFSWSGSLLIDIWTQGRGVLNQYLFKVTSADYPKWFYYYWTEHHLTEFQRVAAYKATTMGHIKRHHLRDAKVYVANDRIMKLADEQINPHFELTIQNELEAQKLASIRDTLLPKLISGELRVPEAEKLVEEN